MLLRAQDWRIVGQMEAADGRFAACCGTRCAHMPTARWSRRQEGVRTSSIASGSTHSAEMAQMLGVQVVWIAHSFGH